jgi:glycosyltransferase involved in cell wall biosynthesis/spore maturation protein CgeB/ubiquinone/menaquinone biosynthesis C-methylase UbiE/predicted  nucleic acid-binding Zn-ribbon protein
LNDKDQKQNSAQTEPSIDIHDRVAEAYYGLMGQQFMRETQARIHWICRQIQGKSVLDVGCSQGIVPILLAREGLRAIGIDSSPKAIDEANHYLANEPKQVLKHVSFVNSDFLSWDHDDVKIDTVVMSEVLEHLTRPESFLETAARILPKKGRLIVTVPFGINDFIDHKHTFYLLEPLRLISKHFDVAEIEILGKWLGIVADRRPAANSRTETFQPTIAVMEKLESAFGQTERVLRDELTVIRKKLEEANQKYRGVTEQVTTLKQRVTEEETTRKVAEQGQRQAAGQLEQTQCYLKEEQAALQQQVAQLIQQEQAHSAAADEAAKNLVRLKAELEAMRGRLEEAKQKYRGVTEQVTTLKQRVTEEERARQAAEKALAQATTMLKAELEEARVRLEEANQKYRGVTEQVTALKQRVTQEEAAHSRLEEVNQKYRGAIEQVTALKQRVTEEERARQAAEQALAQATTKLKAELEAMRGRLEEANQKYRGANEQISTLKQRVTQEEAMQQGAEKAQGQAAAQLAEVQRSFQEERKALQQQLAQLSQEGQAKTVTVHEGEKKLIRLEAELEARSKLEEANQKYQAATEQVSRLKQQVTQEEVARKTAEQALQAAEKKLTGLDTELAAVRTRLEEANQKYRGATEQVSTLKQQVTEEERARQVAAQGQRQAVGQLEQATAQLAQSQVRLQDERTALQQQIAQLGEQGQAQSVAAHEAEKQLFRLEAELEAVRGRLEETNQKYREATEQVSTLKQQVTEEERARQVAEQGQRQAVGQLEQANLKYRQVTAEQIPELKNKLETQYSKTREGQHALEQLRLDLRKDRKTVVETARQIEQVRQQKKTIEHQLVKTRGMMSFQLGYLLIHGFKSVNGFLSLPTALWALRKEAIQRRKKKAFLPGPPKPPSSSEPSVTVSQPSALIETLSQEPLSNRRAISAEAAVVLTTQSRVASAVDRKLNIACIMDEFTCSSFQPEAILHQLTPSNWRAELEGCNPDLLFIESAWRGKDELWGNKVGHTSVELQGIAEWCGTKKVPTVFWCKEDPIHFETFLNTAKLFDYVFTTDIDCIHRYKAALGHDRVYLLPFACQPATNNPIETYERKDAFCFAGAYYVRYPERTRDLGNFVLELPAFRPLEIYDRNYGKNDPNYQFPEEYRPYIVGTLPFDQIEKAYKGYRYAINLNSIKQSQSMFARRVFELLGSNTITISNFSRGVRLLFGDLVITSDSGHEIVRRLNQMAGNEEHSRKLRLAALRKVMSEHTYGQRLAYVVSKVSGKAIKQSLPHIAVLAHAANQRELEAIQSHYQGQRYANTALYVVVGDGVTPPVSEDPRVHFIKSEQAKEMVIDRLDSKAGLVAGMVAEDYYGPNYLEDMALATRYTQAELIGKAARYTWEGGGFQLKQPDDAYHHVQSLPARAAAIRRQTIAKENVLEWVQSLGTRRLQADQGLAIDEFNYCEQGAAADSAQVRDQVDDLPGLNTGLSIDNLLERAERIAPESNRHDDCPSRTGKQLAADFGKMPSGAITLAVDAQSWRVGSTLPDGKHEYLYATVDHSPEELGFTDQVKVYLDVTPGLNIQLVIQFLDAQKQKISHVIQQANRNQEAVIPPGTDWIRFGLRFYAGGHAEIKDLVLGHRNLQPAEILSQAEHLLLTNQYPSYSDLYRNGFVHTRVRAYHARAVRCDVFRLRPDEAVSYHEFEDVNVVTGSQEVLHQMLASGRYKSVLVHFLDSSMWDVLQHHVDRVKVLVWVHGAEIQPWHRRDFDHQTQEQRAVARRTSDERMAFWRALLQPVPANLKLVFVSRYFAEEVMQDVGLRIPERHYTIIHNPINTELFNYQEKSVEQRKKVLSIRPYASAKYANDLSVKAIQRLSQEPWFYHMEFRMIGDGPLFEETLAPLREFRNVYIEQRFLNQQEIAALHKEYGIFLCPTRMDAQGVSRDEAMASGLVPVTNAVTAIPEFVDDRCGILVPGEDAEAMARGISLLYEHPERFSAMSEAAAKRVRAQSDAQRVIGAELAVVLDDSEPIRRSVLMDAA